MKSRLYTKPILIKLGQATDITRTNQETEFIDVPIGTPISQVDTGPQAS